MKRKILFILVSFYSLFFVNVYASTVKEESAVVKVGSVDALVYDVEITWGKMDFIYTEQINYVWNSENYVYEIGDSTYSWVNKDNYVDINNKSYHEINVNLEYINLKDGINGAFDVANKKILGKTSNRFSLILNGKLEAYGSNYVKVGSINLKIY